MFLGIVLLAAEMIAFSSSSFITTASAQPASESYYGDSYGSDYDSYGRQK